MLAGSSTAVLIAEGGISGRVTAASGDGALVNVIVEIYDINGQPVPNGFSETSTNGTYTWR
jgi:hypothetical protein